MTLHVIPGGLGAPVPGWTASAQGLPPARTDVPQERRERAALILIGVGRGYSPEELCGVMPADVLEAFADDLECSEALAHVDLLANVLVPRR